MCMNHKPHAGSHSMLVRVWPPPGSPHKRGPWVAGRRRVARLIGTCLISWCGQFRRGPPTLQRRSSPRRGHVSSYTCLRVARNNTWSVGSLTLQPVKGRWRGNECRGLLRQLAIAWSVGDSHPPPGNPCNTWSVGGRTLQPLSSGKGRFTAVCAVESQLVASG